MFNEFEQERLFRRMWDSVRVERGVAYSLFTFGDSDLPYFLVTPQTSDTGTVCIREGQITISRARIITPDNMRPEFRDFFEENEDLGLADFLMARSAAFTNMKLSNRRRSERIVTDTIQEAVDRLNAQLDADEDDRKAILSAPEGLAGMALMKYATQRITDSASDNLNELRDRGFLP